MKKKGISFFADKILVRGPRVDGGYVISFEVGEYEKGKVAYLILIDSPVKVTVNEEKN